VLLELLLQSISRVQIPRNKRSLTIHQYIDQKNLQTSRLMKGKDRHSNDKKRPQGKGKRGKGEKSGPIPSYVPSFAPSSLKSEAIPSLSPAYGIVESKLPSQSPTLSINRGTRIPSSSLFSLPTSIPSVSKTPKETNWPSPNPSLVPFNQLTTSPLASNINKTNDPSLAPSQESLTTTVSPSAFGTKLHHVPSMSPSAFQTNRSTFSKTSRSARPTMSPSTLSPSSMIIISQSPSMVVNSYSYSYHGQNPTRQSYSYTYSTPKPSRTMSYSYSYFYHDPQPSRANQELPTCPPTQEKSGYPQIAPSLYPVTEYVPAIPIAVTIAPSSLQQGNRSDVPTIVESSHPARSAAPSELDTMMVPSTLPFYQRTPIVTTSMAEENEEKSDGNRSVFIAIGSALGTTAIVGGLYCFKWRKRHATAPVEGTDSSVVNGNEQGNTRLGITARAQA